MVSLLVTADTHLIGRVAQKFVLLALKSPIQRPSPRVAIRPPAPTHREVFSSRKAPIMQASLRTFLLTAAALFFSVAPVYAQRGRTPNGPSTTVLDVNAGYLYLSFEQTFYTTLSMSAVDISFHGTVDAAPGVRGFRVYGGLCDTTSGAGEFQSVGDIQFLLGTNVAELYHLTLDTTGQVPVITAELLWNGVVAGRIPVFTLVTSDLTGPVTGSTFSTPTVALAVNDSFVTLFNSLFHSKILSLGLGAGTTSLTAGLGSLKQS